MEEDRILNESLVRDPSTAEINSLKKKLEEAKEELEIKQKQITNMRDQRQNANWQAKKKAKQAEEKINALEKELKILKEHQCQPQPTVLPVLSQIETKNQQQQCKEFVQVLQKKFEKANEQISGLKILKNKYEEEMKRLSELLNDSDRKLNDSKRQLEDSKQENLKNKQNSSFLISESPILKNNLKYENMELSLDEELRDKKIHVDEKKRERITENKDEKVKPFAKNKKNEVVAKQKMSEKKHVPKEDGNKRIVDELTETADSLVTEHERVRYVNQIYYWAQARMEK